MRKDSQTDILESMRPYFEVIYACIRDAVLRFQEKLASESGVITQTTKASFIRDWMVEYGRQRLGNDPRVRIVIKKRMVIFVFKRPRIDILLRFKKFDKYLRTSNSITFQASAFSNQEELFSGCLNFANLNAGYRWNQTGTDIECYFAYPNGLRTSAWTAIIPNDGEELHLITTPTATPPPKPAVRPKTRSLGETNEATG